MSAYTIALDMMGGDNAPEALIEGAKRALEEFKDIHLILCGPKDKLSGITSERITIVEANEVISMDEAPMMAVRRKTDSSLVRAMLEVREGRAQAVISAGSTGAVLAGGMLRIGRIKGIERPALAPVLPGKNGPVMFIDSGANVDCQPKYLNQFGLMGAAYMSGVMGIKNPKVALANIGVESEKGNKLSKEAYELMKNQTAYAFDGNIEARDIMTGDHPVIVFDGFDGNLLLKYSEGFASLMSGMLKEEFMRDFRSKIGALLAKPALKRFKKRMDYHDYGGAPLLGVEGMVVKSHGSSDAKAIFSAIRQTRSMIEGDIVGKIKMGLSNMNMEDM